RRRSATESRTPSPVVPHVRTPSIPPSARKPIRGATLASSRERPPSRSGVTAAAITPWSLPSMGSGYVAVSELVGLGRALERERRGLPPADRLRHEIEPPRSNLTLMLARRVAGRLEREFALLQAHVRRHALVGEAFRQLEHPHIEGVEPRERDELEAVAHGAELLLERGDLLVVEPLLPVERGRAVVGEELPGKLGMDALGERPGVVELRRRGLAPQHVRVRRVRTCALDRGVHAAADAEEPLLGAIPAHERAIPLVDVGREQARAERV